ncbi:bifunctional DNA primase/polymerase [Verrucosispora sp. WMMD1129]|uniref:bifunctional DNA primase/polymerase n=1 Tax=Verrucosispora sp. WMMD1129 TaxID=3016093 RepID=UPI00249B221E|nr:bifunctional DNA primase/polymerase [Verrucosispora sp. WMMD1129]WFE46279.1 bifunctional DNA primase/polymerase [Verrucosispora sp. WMMD1129]
MPQTRNRPGVASGAASGVIAATTSSVTESDDIPHRPVDLLNAALAYAEVGWPVFPCAAGDKAPLTRHGFKDATTDPARITAWWRQQPHANIAVATGAPGPDVLDVDTKNGLPGMALFRRVLSAGLLRGAAAIIRTPSGGLHVWFTGTDQRGGATGEGRALELKARGGYVLLPPSYVETGTYAGRYELVEHRETCATVDFAAIRELLEPPRPAARTWTGQMSRQRAERLAAYVSRATEGSRNKALFWAACRAAESGAGPGVYDALVDAAVRAGLPRASCLATVQSAQRTAGSAA